MESQHEEINLREIPDLDTLHELLARLNEVEHFRPVTRTEHITVEDVAEALGLDADFVERELAVILEEHRNARLAGALRELEEPLYRVERTGHAAHDPLENPIMKLRSVQILAERNQAKPVFPRRALEESKADKVSGQIGKVLIGFVVGWLVVLCGKAIIVVLLSK